MYLSPPPKKVVGVPIYKKNPNPLLPVRNHSFKDYLNQNYRMIVDDIEVIHGIRILSGSSLSSPFHTF